MPDASPIDHGRHFCCTQTAHGRFSLVARAALASVDTGELPVCNVYIRKGQFCGAVAAWLRRSTKVVTAQAAMARRRYKLSAYVLTYLKVL